MHTPLSIEARDQSRHRPPPHTHTHKRRRNFSIRTAKGKDLEFPDVMTSVQITDLDCAMVPPATSLFLPATIRRSEMCQAPPQAASGTRVYVHRKYTRAHRHYSYTNTTPSPAESLSPLWAMHFCWGLSEITTGNLLKKRPQFRGDIICKSEIEFKIRWQHSG